MHIVYWLQCNLNALNTEIKEHSDTYTHNTLNNNHLRTLKEQYSKSAKEKRMITLLRVYPWAFCDYGYLFVAEWYSQSQNKCKYWSLSGYENTCKPQIISWSLPPQNSLALPQLLSFRSVTTVLLLNFASWYQKEEKINKLQFSSIYLYHFQKSDITYLNVQYFSVNINCCCSSHDNIKKCFGTF